MLKKIIICSFLIMGASWAGKACSGTFYVCNMEEFETLRAQLLENCDDDDVVNIEFISCIEN